MKKDMVLLAEDDSTLSFIIEDALRREGFDTATASNGEDALRRSSELRPDIVIADVMMPRMDGFEMVRRLRLADADVPVLFLTARSAIDDVVNGFSLGGNDYLRKPFQIAELVVRIRALLRHRQSPRQEDAVTTVADCTLDCATQRLFAGGKEYRLTHIEVLVLRELFTHPNEVVEATTLMLRIWHNDAYHNLNRLHGFIYKLRKYLSSSRDINIINVRGIGYKLSVSSKNK